MSTPKPFTLRVSAAPVFPIRRRTGLGPTAPIWDIFATRVVLARSLRLACARNEAQWISPVHSYRCTGSTCTIWMWRGRDRTQSPCC
jgi:hypothetical protein